MLTEAEYRQRRWATYGVVELEKELPHFHRAMPESAVISDLERYLDKRRAESHPSPSTYYVKPTRIERCDIGQNLNNIYIILVKMEFLKHQGQSFLYFQVYCMQAC